MFMLNFQRCKIKFGSWTYNGFQLNVSADHKNKQGDTSKFIKNGEWDLSEFPVTRNEEKYACCPEPYPDVTFTLLIKRRTRYYYINMLLPNMFITGKIIYFDFITSTRGNASNFFDVKSNESRSHILFVVKSIKLRRESLRSSEVAFYEFVLYIFLLGVSFFNVFLRFKTTHNIQCKCYIY